MKSFHQRLLEVDPHVTEADSKQLEDAIRQYAVAHQLAYEEAESTILGAVKGFGIPEVEGEQFIFDITDNPGINIVKAPSELSDYDISEMQEAARQLSAMAGISTRQAMKRMMKVGVGLGKISKHTKMPRLKEHEEKPCLNCGEPKRHSNSFCSRDCCFEYREKKK